MRSLGRTLTRSLWLRQLVPTQRARQAALHCQASVAMDKQALMQEAARLVPTLTSDKHKGQAGKVAVIGGCREYTGAPFFAAISALKVGADISHVFCTEGAAAVIKSYSPELIVHPYVPCSPEGEEAEAGTSSAAGDAAVGRAVEAVAEWLDRFQVLVVGPGLGRDPRTLAFVAEVMRRARQLNLPMVVDADGLWLVNKELDLVKGYENVVLTPNGVEFGRLAAALEVDPSSETGLRDVCARLSGPVIVRKGREDCISDGTHTAVCDEQGSYRRAGGQGDVLSGCIATFAAWAMQTAGVSKEELHGARERSSAAAPPLLVAAYAGCLTTRHASRAAFEKHRRSMGATDVIAELGSTVDALWDS